MTGADSFYSAYLKQVEGQTPVEALQNSLDAFLQLYPAITEDKWNYRYAPEKWSIKELMQHVADSERVFSYRALCFARGETQSLPPFDENLYALNSFADYRTGSSIAEEFLAVRNSTLLMFKGFAPDAFYRMGTANDITLSVEELGKIIAGHQLHHVKVLRERYLV